jgi:hypothetical protein
VALLWSQLLASVMLAGAPITADGVVVQCKLYWEDTLSILVLLYASAEYSFYIDTLYASVTDRGTLPNYIKDILQ